MNSSILLKNLETSIRAALPRVLDLRSTRSLKADDSFVTEGDLMMENVIAAAIETHCPQFTIISEESPLDQIENVGGNFAVIDPIDGTENFTSGLKEWGVSISIYENRVHSESMIALPELGIYLTTGMQLSRHTSRIHGISSSLSPEQIGALKEKTEYRIIGCCVYSMWAVVTGAFASFENPRGANSWDILAGLNLALEHGLEVTVENEKYAGEYLAPTRKYRFKVEQQ